MLYHSFPSTFRFRSITLTRRAAATPPSTADVSHRGLFVQFALFYLSNLLLCLSYVLVTLRRNHTLVFDPLPDRLASVIPRIDPQISLALQLVHLAIAIYAFATCVRPYAISLLYRTLRTAGILIVMKSVFIISTVFPYPSARCVSAHDDRSLAAEAALVFLTGGLLPPCAGAFFPSRMILSSLIIAFTFSASLSRVLRLGSLLVGFAVLFTMVISRASYTVDLVLTPVMTILTWNLCPHPLQVGSKVIKQ